MFNFETVQNFLKRDSTIESDLQAIEQAKDILKRYDCFNQLLNGKEKLYEMCKDVMLKDILLSVRGSSQINRDYLIGYQDALEVFISNLSRYKEAHDIAYNKKEI